MKRHVGTLLVLAAGSMVLVSSTASAVSAVGSPVLIGSTGNNTYPPNHSISVAYGNGDYALAYVDASSSPSVYQRLKVAFIDASSGAVTATHQMNTVDAATIHAPSISYNSSSNEFGVVWVRYTAEMQSIVEFRTVTAAGASPSAPVTVSGSYPGLVIGPAIAWDGSNYAMVFSYSNGSYWSAHVMKFNASGTPVVNPVELDLMPLPSSSIDPMVLLGGEGFQASIAAGDSKYAVLYAKPEGKYNTYYTCLNSGLGIVAGPSVVSVGGGDNQEPMIAHKGGDVFGGVWQWMNGYNSGTIYFARFDSSGMVAGSRTTLVTGALSAANPDIVWDGDQFACTWFDAYAGGEWNARAATVSASTGLPEGTVAALRGPVGSLFNSRVASKANDQYLAAWHEGASAVYSNRVANQIMLTTSANPTSGGTVSPAGTTGPYNSTDIVPVSASEASTDWQFTGWSGDATGTDNPLSVTMDRAKNIVANFHNKTWPKMTAAVSPTGTGSATVNGASSAQAPLGWGMNLVANPYTGYKFNSWKDSVGAPMGDTPNERTNKVMMPATDTTIYAHFDVAYNVVSTANPTNGGSVSPVGDSLWYASGTQVTFTATPAASYTFAGWTVNGQDGGSANPMVLTIDSNKTVYANFTYTGGGTTYTLSTSVSPTGTGTVSPSGTSTYAAGSSVQVRATPSTGYAFDKWSGSSTSTANPLTVTMSANKSLTALFREGSSGNAPVISNLKQNSSIKSKRASLTVDYADLDGDLDGGSVAVSYRYKTSGRQYSGTYTIPDGVTSVTGTTSGTIAFQIRFRKWKSSYRSFSMEVHIVDEAGLSSNTLSLTVKKNKKSGASPGDIAGADAE